MSATGDSAVNAQPDGIYVPITTSLLFCINLRHPAELGNTHTVCVCVWLCVYKVEPIWGYFYVQFLKIWIELRSWIFVHSCYNFLLQKRVLLLVIFFFPFSFKVSSKQLLQSVTQWVILPIITRYRLSLWETHRVCVCVIWTLVWRHRPLEAQLGRPLVEIGVALYYKPKYCTRLNNNNV